MRVKEGLSVPTSREIQSRIERLADELKKGADRQSRDANRSYHSAQILLFASLGCSMVAAISGIFFKRSLSNCWCGSCASAFDCVPGLESQTRNRTELVFSKVRSPQGLAITIVVSVTGRTNDGECRGNRSCARQTGHRYAT